jgi:predicted nicotinamide N-methyase
MALAAQLLAGKLAVNKRVLDCGCGLGLVGIAAALAGASSVVLADNEPLALACAVRSAAANGLRVSPDALPLLGPADASQPPPPGGGSLAALRLNWHSPPAALRHSCDLLLLADCLYEKDAALAVAALARHCLAPGGTLLLGDPPLRTPANRVAFGDALADGGWLEEVSDGIEATLDDDGKRVDVRVTMWRRSNDA